MACQGTLGSTTPLRDAVGECGTVDSTHSVSLKNDFRASCVVLLSVVVVLLPCLSQHLMKDCSCTFEGDHSFINAILWVGVVLGQKPLLHCRDNWKHLLQPVVPWLTP